MAEPLQCVSPSSVITGWDFSTGAVKCLAFDLDGRTLAEVRLPTDLWTAGGVSELNLLQLEGQARASTRAIAARLRELGRLQHWLAGGISATHHTAGRIDAIASRCAGPSAGTTTPWPTIMPAAWSGSAARTRSATDRRPLGDPLLAQPSGQGRGTRCRRPTGSEPRGSCRTAPWPAGYPDRQFRRGQRFRGRLDRHHGSAHGPVVPGHARRPGQRPTIATWPGSSCRASSIRTSRSARCRRPGCWKPGIAEPRPLIFPTSDDQQAGLVGGGAVDAGQMAVILGNSAVVNSLVRAVAGSGQPGRHAAQLGPVPLDALLQQRRPVPRPRRRRPSPTGRSWRSRPRACAAGVRRRGRAAVRQSGAVAGRAIASGCSGFPASRPDAGREVPGGAGSDGLPDRPGRARA